jgi:hypothetical protein
MTIEGLQKGQLKNLFSQVFLLKNRKVPLMNGTF